MSDNEQIHEGEIVEAPQPRRDLATTPATPADLLRHALAQGANMETLEKFMDLQMRWDADQARKAYVAAMAAFKALPLTIFKDKHVSFGQTSYDHATIGNVTATICSALAKHGFSHRWDTTQDSGQISVSCVITHELGHSESTVLKAAPDTSGGKNAIQSLASAVTYLQRYTLLAATGMATTDQEDDDGRASGEQVETEQETAEQQAARRKAKHDAALGRHFGAVEQIKQDIEAGNWPSVVVNWDEIPTEDQTALWLAPTKGGCFTTAERSAMSENMTKFRAKKEPT